MGLLDADRVEPQPKRPKYLIAALVLGVLAGAGFWYLFRFHTEKKVIERFFQALVAGNTQQAYRIWKPQPTYSYEDFLEDWGPSGHYGPVRSYRIEGVRQPQGGSGVVVTVLLSPYDSFPSENDAEKYRRSKTVAIWVEQRDQSLSFPP